MRRGPSYHPSKVVIFATVRPSGAKRTMISSVQSSYIAMGPKMADKADPSQELFVAMGAGHCCSIVEWKCVAFSRLSFRLLPLRQTEAVVHHRDAGPNRTSAYLPNI